MAYAVASKETSLLSLIALENPVLLIIKKQYLNSGTCFSIKKP